MSEQTVKKRNLFNRLTINPVCNFIFGEPTEYELQPASKAETWLFRIMFAVLGVILVSLFIDQKIG
ncbi:MAG: hypothetical protein ACYYKD_05670 [Rhodospirillales bacterium]